jgi:hypothetical protein
MKFRGADVQSKTVAASFECDDDLTALDRIADSDINLGDFA